MSATHRGLGRIPFAGSSGNDFDWVTDAALRAAADNPEERTGGTTVLFEIVGRYGRDKMQAWHKACPGSTVEHVMADTGIYYVLHIPPGGAGGEAGGEGAAA